MCRVGWGGGGIPRNWASCDSRQHSPCPALKKVCQQFCKLLQTLLLNWIMNNPILAVLSSNLQCFRVSLFKRLLNMYFYERTHVLYEHVPCPNRVGHIAPSVRSQCRNTSTYSLVRQVWPNTEELISQLLTGLYKIWLLLQDRMRTKNLRERCKKNIARIANAVQCHN